MTDTLQILLQVPSRRELIDKLDRTGMSADAKVIVVKILDTVVAVGQKVFEIGKQVVTFAFGLVQKFPGITFGVGIALTVSFLVAAIPVVGSALAALLTPLLLAFGLVEGALEDLRNGALDAEVTSFGETLEGSLANA